MEYGGSSGKFLRSKQARVWKTNNRRSGGVPAVPTTATFSYTGIDQTFVVPTGVTSVTGYIWGAGGGGLYSPGGAGAYIQGAFAVTPGETLTLIVGQGGAIKQTNVSTTLPATYGGGGGIIGRVGGTDTNGRGSGSGGGRSAIRRGATEICCAGGGGGGGIIYPNNTTAYLGGMARWTGDAQDGSLPRTTAPGTHGTGLGGTQTAGGDGGTTNFPYVNGVTGSRYTGGTGGEYGAGGGGGKYGGGGSALNFDTLFNGNPTGRGAGGGSSDTTNLSFATGLDSSNGWHAPNVGSIYYTGNVAAGSTGTGGGNGLIVLYYLA